MRRSVCLNGEWHFMPDFAGRAPAELAAAAQWEAQAVRVPSSWRWSIKPGQDYQPYDLFAYPLRWNEAQSGLLGRSLRVERQGDERVVLVFKGILQRAVVFFNGVQVYAGDEGFLPVEIDVTELARSGAENDLKVWCGPWQRIETETGRKLLVPEGSWFAQLARGIWQDVFLEYRPAWRIEDACVRTWLRAQRLDVHVTLGRRVRQGDACIRATRASPLPETPRRAAGNDGQVAVCVLDGDEVVLQFAPQVCPVPGRRVREGDACQGDACVYQGDACVAPTMDGPEELHISAAWENPRLWSPEDPHRYTLRVDLLADGVLLDRREIRFGFREVWLDGPNFMLNGQRVNLRGDAWHYQGFVQQFPEYARNWYRLCQETGINFIRLHAMPYPEFYLDLADEMGMLIVDESAIYGSSKQMQADHPAFLAACRAHLAALVQRDRNHPSVVIWSMQNEMRWVDGRDGYKAAMPDLTVGIKALDDTRPVSYDGDNRLVDPAGMEIVSMHYNIDGTVAGWQQDKPLIFGEHGPWHYVSPQVCTDFAGSAAYLDYESCMESIGESERQFIEYARRAGVTGITPFNISNYCMKAMPDQDQPLEWAALDTPGPKPLRIPAHSLTLNNGLLPTAPRWIPNAAYAPLKAAFKAVTVIANSANRCFYGGGELRHSFQVYNDTLHAAEVRLEHRLWGPDGSLWAQGSQTFRQDPGAALEWTLRHPLPDVGEACGLRLEVDLFHAGQKLDGLCLEDRIYPRGLKSAPLDLRGKRAACLGRETFELLRPLLPGLAYLEQPPETLDGFDLLVIGRRTSCQADPLMPVLAEFVTHGGFLLVLEQDQFALGELTLSGKKFFSTFRGLPDHPALAGLSDLDLRLWDEQDWPSSGPRSANAGETGYLVQNAFLKPEQGDCQILLECGQGDFGNGGLYWTPLVEAALGAGRVMCCQIELCAHFESTPQAALLLRGLLEYSAVQPAAPSAARYQPVAARVGPASAAPPRGARSADFLTRIGLAYTDLEPGVELDKGYLVVVDPEVLDDEMALRLGAFARAGGSVLVLAAEPRHAARLSILAGQHVAISARAAYQAAPAGRALAAGISPHDLYLFEKVTYTQPPKINRLLCQHAVAVTGGQALLRSVHNPWENFFVRGEGDEYQKIAIATRVEQAAPETCDFATELPVGQGRVIFWQVDTRVDSEKVRRATARLLGSLGARLEPPVFSYHKQAADYGIAAFMAIPHESYQEYSALEAYFSDPGYLLNNLGEGVYGWMQRQEKSAGWVTLPNSAGRTFFLTAFIESEVNRDPARRETDALPDSSIVPDFYIEINCPFRLFLNGRRLADCAAAPAGVFRVEEAVLRQGLNRLAIVCHGGGADIRLNAWFKDRLDNFLPDLHCRLTLD